MLNDLRRTFPRYQVYWYQNRIELGLERDQRRTFRSWATTTVCAKSLRVSQLFSTLIWGSFSYIELRLKQREEPSEITETTYSEWFTPSCVKPFKTLISITCDSFNLPSSACGRKDIRAFSTLLLGFYPVTMLQPVSAQPRSISVFPWPFLKSWFSWKFPRTAAVSPTHLHKDRRLKNLPRHHPRTVT